MFHVNFLHTNHMQKRRHINQFFEFNIKMVQNHWIDQNKVQEESNEIGI